MGFLTKRQNPMPSLPLNKGLPTASRSPPVPPVPLASGGATWQEVTLTFPERREGFTDASSTLEESFRLVSKKISERSLLIHPKKRPRMKTPLKKNMKEKKAHLAGTKRRSSLKSKASPPSGSNEVPKASMAN